MILGPRLSAAAGCVSLAALAFAAAMAWPGPAPARKPAPVPAVACQNTACGLSGVHAPACGGGWTSGPAEATAMLSRKERACR